VFFAGLLAALLLAALTHPVPIAAQTFPVESTFDFDEEGWTVKVGCVLTWQANGGNPDGYLETQDNDPGSGALISAPPEYLGDWSSLDGAGELAFDLIFIDDPDYYPITGTAKVVLHSLSDTASYTWTAGPTTHWRRFCAPLDEAQWNVTSGDWLSLLSDVTEVLVRMDFTQGQDINGIDNVYVGPGTGGGGGVPDPGWCDVPCLPICPQGQFDFIVTVREDCGSPLEGVEVVIDFSACDSVTLCEPEGPLPYTIEPCEKRISATTDAGGTVIFPIRGGGISYLAAAEIWADDVLIAERPVASCDQDGDLQLTGIDQGLFVSKAQLGLEDPTADFDCDGLVAAPDAVIFVTHFSELHSCEELVVASSALSTVDTCLVIEPHGGYDFDVVVRDQNGSPMAGATVVVDFTACPGIQLCSPGAGETYVREDSLVISATTAGDGSVTFPIRGGGACADSLAEIRVGCTVLAKRSVASPDQSGNLVVYTEDFVLWRNKLLGNPLDPSGDLDCDGFITPADSVEMLAHWQNQCCGSVTGPDPCSSYVIDCFVICPEGDGLFEVQVMTANGVPVASSEVTLDLLGCPDVHHCRDSDDLPGEWEFRAERKLVGVTDVNGEFISPLRGGGYCLDTVAVVSVEGMVLGRRVIRSPDYDHDLYVGPADSAYFAERFITPGYDSEIDLTCNGEEDLVDYNTQRFHNADPDEHACVTAVDAGPRQPVPPAFALRGGIPNPTSGGAVIGFDLPVKSRVILRVCDVRGRIIRTAIDAKEMPAGSHVWEWDGRNDGGARVGSGVYFYYMETPQYRSTKRAVILR
jgi:hypothetical protein